MKRLIAVLCLFLASVSVSVAQQDRLRVVTTTADLRSLAKAIGAERVNVSSLVGSGETPEEYQPKLQDAEVLKHAQVVVRAAPGIDPWFDKLLARTAQKHSLQGINRGEPGYLDASTGGRGQRSAQRQRRLRPLAARVARRTQSALLARPEKRGRHHREDAGGVFQSRSEEREILRG